MVLPLVYAALGEALKRGGDYIKRESWAALAALALAPWGETKAAAAFIAYEPTLREGAGTRLVAEIEQQGCARWTSGAVWLHPKLRDVARDEQMAPLDADILALLSGRKVSESEACRFEAKP
jgi:hypothetical protein